MSGSKTTRKSYILVDQHIIDILLFFKFWRSAPAEILYIMEAEYLQLSHCQNIIPVQTSGSCEFYSLGFTASYKSKLVLQSSLFLFSMELRLAGLALHPNLVF